MDGEDLGIGFLILLNQETATRIIAKAAGIDTHHIDCRLPIDNPMRQLPASTTGRCHAKAMPFIEPEILQPPSRPDNGRTIGRIGDCAVIHLLNAHFAKGGHTAHGRQNIRLKTFQRIGEKLIFAVCRWAIDITGGCPDFIRPKQQAACFFAHIIACVGFPQNAHFGQALPLALHNRRVLFRDDILVLDRNDRNIEADHGPRLPRKIARAGNDMFASDVALIG